MTALRTVYRAGMSEVESRDLEGLLAFCRARGFPQLTMFELQAEMAKARQERARAQRHGQDPGYLPPSAFTLRNTAPAPRSMRR